MSLLDRITAVLDGAGARYAVIGAAAMAEVSADIDDLPAHCRAFWERILSGDLG